MNNSQEQFGCKSFYFVHISICSNMLCFICTLRLVVHNLFYNLFTQYISANWSYLSTITAARHDSVKRQFFHEMNIIDSDNALVSISETDYQVSE